jgi:hypothetical protein
MTTMTKTDHKYLRTLAAMVVSAIAAGSMMAYSAEPAHADTTFTVNNTLDSGTGPCRPAVCSLRQAINDANATSGKDTIKFDIRERGVQVIKPATKLPQITDSVTIDGYSQSGSSPNTLDKGTNAKITIELNGSLAETNNGTDPRNNLAGLDVAAPNTVIKGLAIRGFLRSGIKTSGEATTGVKVEGNFLGTNASGTSGQGGDGVSIGSAGTTVGGSTPAARNLISANGRSGVQLFSDNNVVSGNLIGTKKDGIGALGNSFSGVSIFGRNNLIGGTTPGSANTIAFNGGDGVAIENTDGTTVNRGNRVLGNSIFSNGAIGIDLGNGRRLVASLDGPTPNDPGDADSGPNNLQNFPVISSAKTANGTTTTIEGTLDTTPNKPLIRVQFFSKPSGADADAEGQNLEGETFVSTGADGKATFTFQPVTAVAVGSVVTATATDPAGNTSEFSAPKSVGFSGTIPTTPPSEGGTIPTTPAEGP